MGLPLFVAPVESDLPSKAVAKGTTTSPSRSEIRRLSRQDSRDRRNASRAGAIRYGSAAPRLPPNQDSRLPWVESPGPVDQQSLAESRPLPALQAAREARETPWQRSAGDERHREQFEEQMATLFGSDWRERGPSVANLPREPQLRDTDERWWPMEARPAARARRAQVVAPLPSRFDRSPDQARSYPNSPPLNHRTLRMSGLPSLSPAAVGGSRAAIPRYHARLLRSLRDRRSPAARHGLDGLGDRDRSLSPEVWDTLLSTMTPDPQPPSASSSFASTVASQSAGPSSSTPTSAPDVLEEAAADAQCESGCEHSDVSMEEDGEEIDGLPDMRPRRPLWREMRRPPNSYSPARGQADGRAGRSIAEARRTATQPAGDDVNAPDDAGGREVRAHSTGQPPRGMPLARLLNRAEGWGSQASGEEASEDEIIGDNSQQGGRGESIGPALNATLSGEEDWAGMQRIVRSLARREDIPDEWWAEAGLSRTLPQEDGVTQ
ncbi:hypothetical protein CDD83_9060 [Cordyceps sp. RAO-2017]|nr:hypothetical protein CDD83_9060 [Cordyceps sp. RAO-2017]